MKPNGMAHLDNCNTGNESRSIGIECCDDANDKMVQHLGRPMAQGDKSIRLVCILTILLDYFFLGSILVHSMVYLSIKLN